MAICNLPTVSFNLKKLVPHSIKADERPSVKLLTTPLLIYYAVINQFKPKVAIASAIA